MTEKLSQFHAAVLIFMIQSGVVVLSLPNLEARYFGTNGWLFLIVCFLAVSVNICLISIVFRLAKGRSVFAILEQSVPKFILYPLYFVVSMLWGILGSIIAKEYVLIFQMVAFPTIDPMLFLLALLFLAFLLVTKGINSISKSATVFFWLYIWMLLLLFYFFSDFEWGRLTPFVFKGGHDQWRGGLDIFSAFLGYELCLLLFPFADKNTKLMKATFVGSILLIVTYLAVSVVSFGFFSLGQLKILTFPVIELLAYIKFPFVERVENLLYGFFLFSSLITSTMYIWAAKETSQRIWKRADTSLLTFFIILITYGFTFIPRVLNEVWEWLEYVTRIQTGLVFGLPLILIFLLQFQRGREGIE
ncbi:GerAB/ArcD/ProY family transporter [Brevibacillus sp. B_LB10_24]|uniref:GerAB/ArcD/ProY family transporter n=1 Tax=Brevibacillus sp. B_LB10_24 TaxID=3380645 RepID=UPI0038B9FF9E